MDLEVFDNAKMSLPKKLQSFNLMVTLVLSESAYTTLNFMHCIFWVSLQ